MVLSPILVPVDSKYAFCTSDIYLLGNLDLKAFNSFIVNTFMSLSLNCLIYEANMSHINDICNKYCMKNGTQNA